MLEIVVQRGKHGLGPPDGFELIIRDLLTDLGFNGKWKVMLGARVKGTSHTQGIHLKKTDGPSIIARIQPGDNSTRCVCRILPPQSISPRAAFARITKYLANPPRPQSKPIVKEHPQPVAVPQERKVVVPEKKQLPTTEARTFLGDPSNLQLALLAFADRCKSNPERFVPREDWLRVIRDELSISGTPQALGKISQALSKKGWIVKMPVGAKGFYHGYSLTDRGAETVGIAIPQDESDRVSQLEDQLRTLVGKVAEFDQDEKRKTEITARLQELADEQKKLQAELARLGKKLKTAEYRAALKKLVRIQGILANGS